MKIVNQLPRGYKILNKNLGLKFPRLVKTRPPAGGGSKELHDQIQDHLIEYARRHGFTALHVSDQLLSFIYSGRISAVLSQDKRLYGWLMRVRSDFSDGLLGVPDVVIIDWTEHLLIEVKTGKAKPRKGQKEISAKSKVHVVGSIGPGIKLINEFKIRCANRTK